MVRDASKGVGKASIGMGKLEMEVMALAESRIEEAISKGDLEVKETRSWYKPPPTSNMGAEELGFIDSLVSKKVVREEDVTKLAEVVNKKVVKETPVQKTEEALSFRPKYEPIEDEVDLTPKSYNGGRTQPPARVAPQVQARKEPPVVEKPAIAAPVKPTAAVAGDSPGTRKLTQEELETTANALQNLVKHRGGGPFGKGRLEGKGIVELEQTLNAALEVIKKDAIVSKETKATKMAPAPAPAPARAPAPVAAKAPPLSPAPAMAKPQLQPEPQPQAGGSQEVPIAMGLNNFLQNPGAAPLQVRITFLSYQNS